MSKFLQGLLKGGKRLLAAFDKQNPKKKKDKKIGDAGEQGEQGEQGERDELGLSNRIALRKNITEAFDSEDPDTREERLSSIRDQGTDPDGKYAIDPAAMDREILEERKKFVGGRVKTMEARRDSQELEKKEDYDAFFARANSPNRTLSSGFGQRSNVYQRKGKLRLAKRLRKDGFGRAAEAVALDYARSPEASAPSIMTPALRLKMQRDSDRASRIRDVNLDLQEQLLKKTNLENRKRTRSYYS